MNDTMPKTVDIRRHCEVGLRGCNNLPHLSKCWYLVVVEDCCMLSTLLVSTVFGTVSSLHPTSFLKDLVFVSESQYILNVGMGKNE